jgi:predicted exporter
MLHPALSRALATAHIEDLHRAAAQRHTIRLAHSVAHEPHVVATSRVSIFSGRFWAGRRDRRSRLDRLPMHREMRSERL